MIYKLNRALHFHACVCQFIIVQNIVSVNWFMIGWDDEFMNNILRWVRMYLFLTVTPILRLDNKYFDLFMRGKKDLSFCHKFVTFTLKKLFFRNALMFVYQRQLLL